jgi:hypothetical protein
MFEIALACAAYSWANRLEAEVGSIGDGFADEPRCRLPASRNSFDQL